MSWGALLRIPASWYVVVVQSFKCRSMDLDLTVATGTTAMRRWSGQCIFTRSLTHPRGLYTPSYGLLQMVWRI